MRTDDGFMVPNNWAQPDPWFDSAAFTAMVSPAWKRTLLPAPMASALATVMLRLACRYSSL